MSATLTLHYAGTAACASMKSGATDASARRSTRASTARAATCPATRRHARMEEHASRRGTPATNVPVCQVKYNYFSFLLGSPGYIYKAVFWMWPVRE